MAWTAASNQRRGSRRWKNNSNRSGSYIGKGLEVRKSYRGRPSTKCIVLLRFLLAGLLAGGIYREVSAGWIDVDTPQSAYNTTSIPLGNTDKKNNFKLVMSDEFNAPGRSFVDGDDPLWTAMNKNDYTNAALHFYSHDRITTENGHLKIATTNEDVNVPYWDDKTRSVKYQKKTYSSGMLQGWNKFCFTGGIVEISAQLPGKSDIAGLWPAMWLMGNIARATFTRSSDFQWPWSYDKCILNKTAGANGEGLFQPQQELHACDYANHYDMHHQEGRGAPEIDILEVMPGKKHSKIPDVVVQPYGSMSYQVAPGVQGERPLEGKPPKPGLWYEEGLEYGPNTSQNIFFYGSTLEHSFPSKTYIADALSANHQLEESHFEENHIYRLEWEPGPDGYLRWFVDGKFAFSISQKTLNKTGSKISDEPMYILLNTAVSSRWGFPAPCDVNTCGCNCWDARDDECECAIPDRMADLFPAKFLIDYVRVYQNPNVKSHKVGCSTDDRPTAKWIAGHEERYHDPQDNHVLFPVKRGGAKCTSSKDCGNGRGTCVKGKCACPKGSGWTGPKCGAPDGFDDIIYETDVKIPLMERPILPRGLLVCMAIVLVAFLANVARQMFDIKREFYNFRKSL